MALDQLQLWYGPVDSCVQREDPRWDAVQRLDEVAAFVCAPSRAEAQRIIEGYSGKRPSDHQFANRWRDHWPSPMNQVTPERGLWILFDLRDDPVKVA